MALKRKRTMRYRRPPIAIEHTGFYPYLLQYNETMAVGLRQEDVTSPRERYPAVRQLV